MKINSTGNPSGLAPLTSAPAVTPSTGAGAAAPTPVSGGTAQGALLQVARAKLSAMPEVDMDKVAEVRAALERGEITFDAAKLAGLIVRDHGNRG
jgi:negative regulator of flagellin synthesis FlgM